MPNRPPKLDPTAALRLADDILAAAGAPRPAPPPPPLPDLRPEAHQALGHVVRLSDIDPEPIHWLSPGRLALGKVTVLDGDPGLGKSTLLAEFAARITRGESLPGGQPSPPRSVLLLAAEDGLFDTIRPRIDVAGGDPHRIVTLNGVPDPRHPNRPVALPGDAPILLTVAAKVDAALIVLDPLAAFLGRRHTASDPAHMRAVLDALNSLAARANAAVVIVRHLTKAPGANPLYRGGGSIGVIGAARCALLLAPDPEDPARRILAVTKGNLAAAAPSLAFHLETAPGASAARIVWDGESRWTAAQLLRAAAEPPAARTALLEARHFLRAALAHGPQPSRDLQQQAAAHGIAHRTLARARRLEDILVRKAPGLHAPWTWELPPSNHAHGIHATANSGPDDPAALA